MNVRSKREVRKACWLCTRRTGLRCIASLRCSDKYASLVWFNTLANLRGSLVVPFSVANEFLCTSRHTRRGEILNVREIVRGSAQDAIASRRSFSCKHRDIVYPCTTHDHKCLCAMQHVTRVPTQFSFLFHATAVP